MLQMYSMCSDTLLHDKIQGNEAWNGKDLQPLKPETNIFHLSHCSVLTTLYLHIAGDGALLLQL